MQDQVSNPYNESFILKRSSLSKTLVVNLLFIQDQVYSKTLVADFPNKSNQSYLIHPEEIGEGLISFVQDQVKLKPLLRILRRKNQRIFFIIKEYTKIVIYIIL